MRQCPNFQNSIKVLRNGIFFFASRWFWNFVFHYVCRCVFSERHQLSSSTSNLDSPTERQDGSHGSILYGSDVQLDSEISDPIERRLTFSPSSKTWVYFFVHSFSAVYLCYIFYVIFALSPLNSISYSSRKKNLGLRLQEREGGTQRIIPTHPTETRSQRIERKSPLKRRAQSLSPQKRYEF